MTVLPLPFPIHNSKSPLDFIEENPLHLQYYKIVFMKKGSKIGEFEEIVILTVGILGDNAYGVTIKDEIEDRVQREVSVGALQTTLRRLEKKGFLAAKQGDTSPSRGGRPKLYFSITPYGKKAIQESREVRNALWDALPPGLLNEIA